jgi:hypothetical protein
MSRGQPYRLTFNGAFRENLDTLVRRAKEDGIYPRVKRALADIEGHLELTPTTWGDPIYRLTKMRFTVYHRIHDELSVVYGVHDSDDFVWWTKCSPVLGHPLCTPSDPL